MQSHAIQLLKPRIVNVDEVGSNVAKITIEPLDRGFGHTLGNALRRVLLSSMPVPRSPRSRSTGFSTSTPLWRACRRTSPRSC